MFKFLISLITLCVLMAKGYAAEYGQWQINGFLTQGFTYTSDNNFLGDSDDSISLEFSEAVLNASRFLTDDVRLTAQGAYRNSSVLDSSEFFLDFLQLDIKLLDSEAHQLGVLAGRVRSRLGLYADVYDIPSAWPTALLPETYYPQSLRSAVISYEGLNFYHHGELAEWTTTTHLGIGLHKDIDNRIIENLWLIGLAESEDTQADEFYNVFFELLSPDQSLALGYSYLYFRWKPPIDFGGANVDVQYTRNNHFLHLSKRWQQWKIESEFHYASQDTESGPLTFPNGILGCDLNCASTISTFSNVGSDKSYSYSGYITLYHYLSSGLSLYTSYGHNVSDKDDLRGKEAARNTGLPNHIFYTKQSLIGFQYEINPQWSVAADMIYTEGSGYLANRDNNNLEDRDKYWTTLFVRVSYNF